jgi:hypothetical protein
MFAATALCYAGSCVDLEVMKRKTTEVSAICNVHSDKDAKKEYIMSRIRDSMRNMSAISATTQVVTLHLKKSLC